MDYDWCYHLRLFLEFYRTHCANAIIGHIISMLYLTQYIYICRGVEKYIYNNIIILSITPGVDTNLVYIYPGMLLCIYNKKHFTYIRTV